MDVGDAIWALGREAAGIDLVSPKTIDEKILGALKAKIDLAGQVLGDDARQWLI